VPPSEHYYNGTGRRKNAVARVRLIPGDGLLVINGKSPSEYFGRRDLETIVLKAMERNPVDRYGTAQEVADDLRRFLDGQPARFEHDQAFAAQPRFIAQHERHDGALAGARRRLQYGGSVARERLPQRRQRNIDRQP